MPAWLSDALCRLLYTDDEEVLFQAARPILVNGIEDVVSRADLADRGIFLMLQPIREQHRRSESELWREFESTRPRILGALLDATVRGLQALPAVRLTRLPRMADFALWVTACETALWPAGTFARAFDANRQAAAEGLIDADPVAICVRRLMAQRASWAGSASDLLRAATYLIGDQVSKNGADSPKNPGTLSGRLRRAQTFLRMLGIEISFSREGHAGTRTIRISSAAESSAMSVSGVSGVSSVSANCHDISIQCG